MEASNLLQIDCFKCKALNRLQNVFPLSPSLNHPSTNLQFVLSFFLMTQQFRQELYIDVAAFAGKTDTLPCHC